MFTIDVNYWKFNLNDIQVRSKSIKLNVKLILSDKKGVWL